MYEYVVSLFSENEDSRIVDIKIDLSDWDKIKRSIVEIKKEKRKLLLKNNIKLLECYVGRS